VCKTTLDFPLKYIEKSAEKQADVWAVIEVTVLI
jgi:hypothetical protein